MTPRWLLAACMAAAFGLAALSPVGGQENRKPDLLDCTGTNGADAKKVNAAQAAWAKYLGKQVEEKIDLGGVKMEFLLIPAGKYKRGSTEADLKRGANANAFLNGEAPQHDVTITDPFYMGKYAVTQAESEIDGKKEPESFLRRWVWKSIGDGNGYESVPGGAGELDRCGHILYGTEGEAGKWLGEGAVADRRDVGICVSSWNDDAMVHWRKIDKR